MDRRFLLLSVALLALWCTAGTKCQAGFLLTPTHALTSSGPGNDGFGLAVAGADGRVFVGAPGVPAGRAGSGLVYEFSRADGSFVRTIAPSTPFERENFGARLAVRGSQLAATAPGFAGDNNTGRALLFDTTNPSNPLKTAGAELNNPSPGRFDEFGSAVVGLTSGFAVAEHGDDTMRPNAGAVHVFNTDGQLLRTLYSPTQLSPGVGYSVAREFGQSIAASGDRLLVSELIGVRAADGSLHSTGRVHQFDAATGELLRTIDTPNPNLGAAPGKDNEDAFGRAVTFAGTDIIVAAPGTDAAGGLRNAGVVYRFDGASGELSHTYQSPVPTSDNAFGLAVAAVNGDVVVGTGNVGAGNTAKVYYYDGSSHGLHHIFADPDPSDGATFGRSIAVVDNDLYISDSDATYVYYFKNRVFKPISYDDPLLEEVFNNSVEWTFYEGSTRLTAQFSPHGMTLREAAALIDVDHFNWIQFVLDASARDMGALGFDYSGVPIGLPFVDPVPGGFQYMNEARRVPLGTPLSDRLPFYLEESTTPSGFDQLTNYTNDSPLPLVAEHPNDPIRSLTIDPHSLLYYDLPATPFGDPVTFTTALVGVRSDGTYKVLRFDGTSVRWQTEGGISNALANTAPFTQPVLGGQSSLIGFVGPGGFSEVELGMIRASGGEVIPSGPRAPSPVPEPTSACLFALGAACLLVRRNRRHAGT